ncbi:hypothetical protein [Corynebacterium kalidii]|uniref:Uncharacterized protein n=1 Tax=Corynebacterium kalidii TaxID=2931982 RepID=A0A9X1WGB0_9CORY|nr:hypothetical protein [Corynebacterium kalidii]MCJ7858544.1 hypothetical protein [Corynebacterium kalidii]
MSDEKKHDVVEPLSVASVTGGFYFAYCIVTGTGNIALAAIACATLAAGIFVGNWSGSWAGRIVGAALAVAAIAATVSLT